jgi:predicted transcriptional regulator
MSSYTATAVDGGDTMQRLPESELDVMLALWDRSEQPVPRAYFDEKLSYRGWTVNALNSFLSRLEDKGFIKGVRQGKNKYYSSIVTREDYLAQEGRGMLNKLYRGSIKNFLLAVSGHEGLDERELDELRQYLNELKEGRAND